MVTGATGFVGSHLIEALLHDRWDVVALARSLQKAQRLVRSGVTVVEGDLHDAGAIRRAVAGVDVIFHLAGLVAARNEHEYLAINRDGTAALVDLAEEAGVGRFLLVSSLAAAGPSSLESPRGEEQPPNPVTAYGRSKLAAEEVVRRSHLRWTILRPPTVYGPRDRELLTVFRLARHGVVPVFGNGRQLLSLVFAPDLARGLVVASENDQTAGGTYFIAHPEPCTSGSLVRSIGHALGKSVRLLPVPRPVGSAVLRVTGWVAGLRGQATVLNPDKAAEFFAEAWTCRADRLEEITGWVAPTALAEGVGQTALWYREAGWL